MVESPDSLQVWNNELKSRFTHNTVKVMRITGGRFYWTHTDQGWIFVSKCFRHEARMWRNTWSFSEMRLTMNEPLCLCHSAPFIYSVLTPKLQHFWQHSFKQLLIKNNNEGAEIPQDVLKSSHEEHAGEKNTFIFTKKSFFGAERFSKVGLFRFALLYERTSFSLSCPCILSLCLHLFPLTTKIRTNFSPHSSNFILLPL